MGTAANRPSVLVVEDDDLIRESVVEYLQDHGFDTMMAADGREALEKLRAVGRKPCVVLLDLMMPIMDGRQFREEQLRDPEISQIPVVVVSASRDVGSLVEGLGIARVFKKPMKLAELLVVVEEHGRRHQEV